MREALRRLAERARDWDHRGLRRTLRPVSGVDLTSNDVLGLASDPTVRDAMVDALREGLPHGSGASRLLTGDHAAWHALEARVADWQGAEAALFMPSGWAANTGLVQALVEPGDLVVSDALNHASLVDGVRLTHAERRIVPHGDLAAVGAALAAPRTGRAWVLVESLYSMDGDAPDLAAWSEVCDRHDAALIVDEAHATGLFGPEGQGRVVEAGLRNRVLLSVHTAGKALGLWGAFVVGPALVIDTLVQRSRPHVFSTAAPPFLAAGLHAALDRVTGDPALRERPGRLAARLRAQLSGVDTGASTTHVVPVIVGSTERALALAAHLAACGWDARAIRPPTVPEGASRVRLVVHAALTEGEVDQLAADVLAGLS